MLREYHPQRAKAARRVTAATTTRSDTTTLAKTQGADDPKVGAFIAGEPLIQPRRGPQAPGDPGAQRQGVGWSALGTKFYSN